MASFQTHGMDELLRQLSDLADGSEELAIKMVDESLPILENELRGEASKHKETGAMVGSIKKTAAKEVGSGIFGWVRPTGKDAKGVRNMAKLAYINYGVHGRPPQPIIVKAVNIAEPKIIQKMQEVFEREVGQ